MKRHKPIIKILIISTISLMAFANGHAQIRTWTSNDGRTVCAEFVQVTGSGSDAAVKLRFKNGMMFSLPFSRLSEEDREWARNPRKGAETPTVPTGDGEIKTPDASVVTSTLRSKLRVWKQMTVPFPTQFSGQLIDAVRRGDKYYITIRSTDGMQQQYSAGDFWEAADKDYLKPFLASARQEEDPWEKKRQEDARIAEEERIRKQGYPDSTDPSWSGEKRKAFELVLAAARSRDNVSSEISSITQSYADRRRRMRDGFAEMSARAAAQSRRPGVLGTPPQMPVLQISPQLLEELEIREAALHQAIRQFRAIEK